MKKSILAITVIISSILFSTSYSIAEIKTFLREYTYQASEVDSKQTCRIIAMEQVKRLLLEELGTYLESNTVVADYQLKKDEITTLSAGVVQTKVMREKWDGEKYWLEAKIDADPDDVARRINDLRNDREKRQKLEASRKKSDDALKDTDRLRKELETDKDNQAKIKQYNEKVQAIKMMSSFSDAMQKVVADKPEEAMGVMMQGMMEMMKNSDGSTPAKDRTTEK